jgi:DNA topoisomerase-2
MDGLKTSLRKILFAAFKKNLSTEIKVAQFSGYVSEHSCYHHGEASLNGAIVGMAQNFVGSNNINLLVPSGQFGTRLQGGNDSASERYIFTMLTPITRLLFPAADDNILTYLSDDGTRVQPIFYAPIVPMILVNGSKGIGTGFSTDIMSYNPLDIIAYLREKLLPIVEQKQVGSVFLPYYEGFKGTIDKISDSKFLIKGRYEKVGTDKIRITELPVGYWTESFKEHLENLIDPGVDKSGKKIASVVRDYDDMSKDTTVDFTVVLQKGKIEELEAVVADYGCNGIEKLFKLYTTNTNTNMHLFNAEDKLRKYASVEEIIDDYFDTRLQMYQTRKDFLIQSLQSDLVLLSNRAKYIQENLEGTIDLRKRKREEVTTMLEQKGYDIIGEDAEYKYLTKMPMDSVTSENVDKIFRECGLKQQELDTVKATTINQMWVLELNNLGIAYTSYKEERQRLTSGVEESKKKKASASSTNSSTKKKMKMILVEDEL